MTDFSPMQDGPDQPAAPDNLPIFNVAEHAIEVAIELYDALNDLHRCALIGLGITHPAVIAAGDALTRARGEL